MRLSSCSRTGTAGIDRGGSSSYRLPQMSRLAVAGPFVAALLAGGCAHAEKAPPAASIDGGAVARSIVLCRTTEADLRRQLGEPTRDGRLHDSRVMSWITQWDGPTRYLAVLLDDRGVVVDVYWDVPTEIPWSPTDQCRGR
jgi:hypothetical protein